MQTSPSLNVDWVSVTDLNLGHYVRGNLLRAIHIHIHIYPFW